ncbi:MAG: hypothetical protein Q8K88_00955, partial [Bradyrhizobium sp.]|nr:hypothetical protein [Bradyrhizobium sp.]
ASPLDRSVLFARILGLISRAGYLDRGQRRKRGSHIPAMRPILMRCSIYQAQGDASRCAFGEISCFEFREGIFRCPK